MATDTLKRLNDVSRVLIAVSGVHSAEDDEERSEAKVSLLDAVERLDKDGVLVLLGVAQSILALGGREEESDDVE